ncbi:hypothetical protein FO519_008195 [Halicephalobus sp. NKZ332]|nr:hypothetical protein FO519_008195 [Halicephalobus sp. NKZ332]
MLCLLLFIVFLPPLWWIIYKSQRRLPVHSGGRCLLVIAHPDDETMFFGPTLLRLVESRIKIFVLSITTGNADGLGSVRKKELSLAIQKLGISPDTLTILDMKDYPDGFVKWETEKLARIILQYIEMLDCDCAITFDSHGVSRHPNHISCFSALQYLYTNGLLPTDVQVFVLETVRIFRKYSSLLDLLLTYLRSTFFNVSSPKDVLAIYAAMRQHKSQLVCICKLAQKNPDPPVLLQNVILHY